MSVDRDTRVVWWRSGVVHGGMLMLHGAHLKASRRPRRRRGHSGWRCTCARTWCAPTAAHRVATHDAWRSTVHHPTPHQSKHRTVSQNSTDQHSTKPRINLACGWLNTCEDARCSTRLRTRADVCVRACTHVSVMSMPRSGSPPRMSMPPTKPAVVCVTHYPRMQRRGSTRRRDARAPRCPAAATAAAARHLQGALNACRQANPVPRLPRLPQSQQPCENRKVSTMPAPPRAVNHAARPAMTAAAGRLTLEVGPLELEASAEVFDVGPWALLGDERFAHAGRAVSVQLKGNLRSRTASQRGCGTVLHEGVRQHAQRLVRCHKWGVAARSAAGAVSAVATLFSCQPSVPTTLVDAVRGERGRKTRERKRKRERKREGGVGEWASGRVNDRVHVE